MRIFTMLLVRRFRLCLTSEFLRGTLAITDGPFMEAKEAIGGYAQLELKSAVRFMELHKRYWQRLGGRDRRSSDVRAGRLCAMCETRDQAGSGIPVSIRREAAR